MFYLLGLVSLSNSQCVNTTNNKHSETTFIHQASLPFCSQHSSRTCCNEASSLSIYRRLYKALHDPPFFENYDGYSTDCLMYSQQALCYECDGDM